MPQRSMHSPVGPLTVSEEDGSIVALDWGWGRDQSASDVLLEAIRQLDGYFDGTRRTFELPLAPIGTCYRQQVWSALCDIPYGETISYGALAARVGGSARAVGQANAVNPIPLLVPCHRVVGASSIGGYSGDGGIEMKRFLLELERMHGSVTQVA